jgi:hypothetical protein
MPLETNLSPPIFVGTKSGVTYSLSTVAQLIDYVQRHDPGGAEWPALRDAAFVAAAVPSPENIDTLRRLAREAWGSGPANLPR